MALPKLLTRPRSSVALACQPLRSCIGGPRTQRCDSPPPPLWRDSSSGWRIWDRCLAPRQMTWTPTRIPPSGDRSGSKHSGRRGRISMQIYVYMYMGGHEFWISVNVRTTPPFSIITASLPPCICLQGFILFSPQTDAHFFQVSFEETSFPHIAEENTPFSQIHFGTYSLLKGSTRHFPKASGDRSPDPRATQTPATGNRCSSIHTTKEFGRSEVFVRFNLVAFVISFIFWDALFLFS